MGNPYSFDGYATNEQRQQAINRAREEIISKLENGSVRYQMDALTHAVIESLARSTDPIEVIDHLLTMYGELSKALFEANTRNAQPQKFHLESSEAVANLAKTIKK